MQIRWIGLALLPLCGCGQAADRGQAPEAGKTVAATASASVVRPFDPAHPGIALLDELVSPRQPGSYAPRDDCGSLPGARDFRLKLAWAVKNRDAQAVAAMASPDVRLGFAGDDGRERMLTRLGENGGELMRELEGLLRLGCAADAQGGMTMPWYFAQDYGDFDSYSGFLVTGVDVPFHAANDAGSPVKQRLSWDLVTLTGDSWDPSKPLQPVETRGGAKGFVATDKLRSMLDYRLLAVRQDGTSNWQISAFVAGD